MATDRRPSIDTALLASAIPYMPNAYVIGPFATRVNFASQQRRALNLVWAINDDFIRSGQPSGLQRKDVCIVGAGLSGLTAAVAVAAFKGNAWILEKEPAPFHKMREANHRDIHPTINFWPQEKVNPSTFFPYFNWHQDNCKNVLDKIWKEWCELERITGIKGITCSCHVTGFKESKGKWAVVVKGEEHKNDRPSNFDVLILATGFGDEKSADGSTSPGYWEEAEDSIEAIRNASIDPAKHYVVSGTGDGGIIEVLRLLFAGFKAGEIEATMNTIIDDDNIPNMVMKIERKIQHKLTDHLLHEEFPIEPEGLNDISKEYWKEYIDVVGSGRIGAFFQNKMEEVRTCVSKVILLGLQSTPLSINQSPFHKLLLTYAFKKGWLEYYQITKDALQVADCDCTTGNHDIVKEMDIELKKLSFKPLRRVWLDNGVPRNRSYTKTQTLYCAFHLCRHGYVSPIDNFFPSSENNIAEFIRQRQALYSEQDFLTKEQVYFFAQSLSLTNPSDTGDWIEQHLEELRAFFVARHGTDVKQVYNKVSSADNSEKPIAIELTRGENFDIQKYRDYKWMIPDRFYGIPIRNMDASTSQIDDPGGIA